jgi:hypothetical protein
MSAALGNSNVNPIDHNVIEFKLCILEILHVLRVFLFCATQLLGIFF